MKNEMKLIFLFNVKIKTKGAVGNLRNLSRVYVLNSGRLSQSKSQSQL